MRGNGGLGNAGLMLELKRFGCKEIREGIGLHTRPANLATNFGFGCRRLNLVPNISRGSSSSMSERRRITVNTVGDVHVVRFNDRKILDTTYIGELGEELFSLLEEPGSHKLLLNFDGVEFLSSGALNKLIFLDRRVKEVSGSLRLTNLRPELNEVFMITRLHELFQIFEDEVEALADLNSDD